MLNNSNTQNRPLCFLLPEECYRLRDKKAQVQWLKERGYDGWYADMDSGGWGEVSVSIAKHRRES